MPYTIDVIQETLAREYGLRISKPMLRAALDTPQWIPDVGRMIAVANNPDNLDTSTKYGVFEGMAGNNYKLEDNSEWRHARLLTPAEIAKCF